MTARIDNPPNGHITSAEACAILGVKRATLYSYVSRGLIRCIETGGRARLYVADDVARVAARSAARRGHAAVAVSALRFGDPVLDSAITSVADERIAYRGVPLNDLLARDAPFEAVAELLFDAATVPVWPAPARLGAQKLPPDAPLLYRLIVALPALALADPARHVGQEAREHDRARRLLGSLTDALCRRATPRTRGNERGASATAPPIAERVAHAFAPRGDLAEHTRLVNAALVAVADHELNVSAFAARVAASAGADLYAAVGAALYAFSGPRHGAASERVAALVDECARSRTARVVETRLARGEALVGFGHPLYPNGDPRTEPLLSRAARSPSAAPVLELVRVVERMTGEKPTVDLALVAVSRALSAPPGFATALFALGRTAGFIAHVLEQRRDGALLRPRARYVGR